MGNCARCLTVGVVSGGMLLLIGCGGPQKVPPPAAPSGSNSTVASGAPGTATATLMSPVTFATGTNFATYANRGIGGWKVTPSSDGASLTCSFRSTGASGAHYGGLNMPIPGTKAFMLTVKFDQGGPAVRAVFVYTQGPGGVSTGHWGSDIRKSGAPIMDGKPYVWQFIQGRPVTPTFWGAAGSSSDRKEVHFFVDVDPNQHVSFRIDKIENQG
jgi:hypothetical protein